MQYRKLISFFLLVAVCALYVEGVPVYDKFKKQGTVSTKKVSSPSPSKKASPSPVVRTTPGAKVSHPVQANPINKPTTVNKYSPANKGSNGQPSGSKSYFSYLSDATSKVSSGFGSGLSSGASLVGTGLSSGASLVGTGLSSGASLVGSGLSSGASAIASLGGGVSNTVGSIASGLGAGSEYTISTLASALSAVSPETLSKALDLSGLPKSLADKVDVVNVIGKVLSNQANPLSGMNLETAAIFLERFGGMVPQLQTTINAVKTVSFVMQKMRAMQNDKQEFEPSKVMLEAADMYFKDVDPAFKKKLIDMAPMVSKAAAGDTDAAMKIASGLVDRNTVLEALKAVGFKSQIQLLQSVINQASDYANVIKYTADTAKVVQGK